ncbi:unnamed protein product [Rodentolepis nana]|uniref:PH domain-containing protein n=1 Tax=Rodentolepis nana TaxID=102285 RepID=A0A0R3T437_RODNA|nr:unnamed protein product [Rodentolepis nana]
MSEWKPIGREVLVNGYLRKAPSSLQSTKKQGLNIFCTGCNVLLEPRWKKRFCIFYKVRNATETQIFFEYYNKASDKNPRGSVDLNSCDCIYEQKVGNQLPNVFVVQTTYRGKRRDYLFSANTPEEMNEWISQLTKVLHMVPDQVSNPAPSDMTRRNGNSMNNFSPSRLVSTASKIPTFSKNSSNLLEVCCRCSLSFLYFFMILGLHLIFTYVFFARCVMIHGKKCSDFSLSKMTLYEG